MLKIQVNTKELLRALKNVIEVCKFDKNTESKDWAPSVLIAPQSPSEDSGGSLMLVGACSHVVAIEEIEIINLEAFQPEQIDVLLKNPEKTNIVDDLEKVAKGISGTSKAKDATVTIEIHNNLLVRFSAGDQLLGELPAHGTSPDFFEAMVSWVDSEPRQMLAPLMLDVGVLSRFKAVRPKGGPNRAPNIDVVGISDHPSGQAFIYRVGETLTGIYRAVDRESFAQGGPDFDGYGTRKALIEKQGEE